MTTDLNFLHPELRAHVAPYFERSDYYQAVSEAFKLVRSKLERLTGKEQANAVYGEDGLNPQFQAVLYGGGPADAREQNHRRGIAYTHLAVQYFRNELLHQVADARFTRDSATTYVALANLAFLSIDSSLSDDWIASFEELLDSIRKGYTRSAFYEALGSGSWLGSSELPSLTAPQLNWLKERVIEDLSLQSNFDKSNVEFMKLEFVARQLTESDLDIVVAAAKNPLTTVNQALGVEDFLRYCIGNCSSLKEPALRYLEQMDSEDETE